MSKTPFNGKCAGCGHVWAVCYLPMPVDEAADLMQRARCPMCGGARIFVAGSGQATSEEKDGAAQDKPVRIRLSRAKGFDLQAHSHSINGLPAVNCARPGILGNPFVIGRDGTREHCVHLYRHFLVGSYALGYPVKVEELQELRLEVLAKLDNLRGKNLACWCALDGKPCHADVLLKVVNP